MTDQTTATSKQSRDYEYPSIGIDLRYKEVWSEKKPRLMQAWAHTYFRNVSHSEEHFTINFTDERHYESKTSFLGGKTTEYDVNVKINKFLPIMILEDLAKKNNPDANVIAERYALELMERIVDFMQKNRSGFFLTEEDVDEDDLESGDTA